MCRVFPVQEGSSENDASTETPGVLSCNEYRTFWISWLNSYLRVGKGHKYNHHEILKLEEAIPHTVGAISITTDGTEGDWHFESEHSALFYEHYRCKQYKQ